MALPDVGGARSELPKAAATSITLTKLLKERRSYCKQSIQSFQSINARKLQISLWKSEKG
jgi:hypothetical protein